MCYFSVPFIFLSSVYIYHVLTLSKTLTLKLTI
jgi:hypothetical protein